MTLLKPTRLGIVPARQLWAHELRQAQALGCTLEVMADNGTAYARLTPTTDKARHALATAANQAGQTGSSIEARQPYAAVSDSADATHRAITSVLHLGQDILR